MFTSTTRARPKKGRCVSLLLLLRHVITEENVQIVGGDGLRPSGPAHHLGARCKLRRSHLAPRRGPRQVTSFISLEGSQVRLVVPGHPGLSLRTVDPIRPQRFSVSARSISRPWTSKKTLDQETSAQPRHSLDQRQAENDGFDYSALALAPS